MTTSSAQATAQIGRVETAGPTPISSEKLTMSAQDKQSEGKEMLAATWTGKKSVTVVKVPVPRITDPHDVIIKVTATAICGSDLHLYHGVMPGMQKGDQLGHEFMGIVEEVGPAVKTLKRGDRVVEAFDIACGSCSFCSEKLFSECDTTNPSADMEQMYGDRIAAFHGYSHLTGGVSGGQSEYARCHHGDVNLLKVPDSLTDMQVVLLSDILPTAWHATEMGEVRKGDVVAIWGAGPVGILAAMCSRHRGAARIILIDTVPHRLDFALSKLPYLEVIDASKHDVYTRLRELVKEGPHVSIEAVGFHYTKSLVSKVEMMVGLQTDPPDMLNEMIVSTRKGGRISIVGAYAGFTNHFHIGAFMEKNLGMRGGQTPVQKYWHYLLSCIEKGELDPSQVITHTLPLSQAAEGYKMFDNKEEGCIKVVLLPHE
ncbi:hypothetical protein WJX73_007560 [Symbiochloris irregularis]|uniref:Enoyl reductase (ER) domain-containing protein n=1 Tax=Symbiochloris irregularis TaxID=706552 RepID=A0AAW1NTK1_9CHLO